MTEQLEYTNYRQIERKRINMIPQSRLLVFMTGFCLGMMFFLFQRSYIVEESGLLDDEWMRQVQRVKLKKMDFLLYIKDVRLIQMILVFMASVSRMAKFFLYCGIGYMGFAAGVIMLTSVYRYDMKGLLFCFFIFFPHGIFYLLICWIFFYKVMGNSAYYEHNNSLIKQKKWYKWLTGILLIVIIFGFFMLGILTEAYVNPTIVQKIALFF